MPFADRPRRTLAGSMIRNEEDDVSGIDLLLRTAIDYEPTRNWPYEPFFPLLPSQPNLEQ
jgi:hypothetical protein